MVRVASRLLRQALPHQSNGPSNPLKAAPQLSLIAAKCILGHTSEQWEYYPPRFQVVRRSDCSLDRIVVLAFHDDSAPPLRNFIRAVSRHVNNSQTTMRQPARQRRWVTTDLKPAPRPRRLGQPGTWSQLKLCRCCHKNFSRAGFFAVRLSVPWLWGEQLAWAADADQGQ